MTVGKGGMEQNLGRTPATHTLMVVMMMGCVCVCVCVIRHG